MNEVFFYLQDLSFDVARMEGGERLGEASWFDLELQSQARIKPESVVGHLAGVVLRGDFGDRVVHGIVTRFTAIASSRDAEIRRYRTRVASTTAALELRRRSRIYQHLSVPEIVADVLERGGLGGDRFVQHLAGEHPKRDYVVQYAETDAGFVRRLCEEDGLYFRFEAREKFDAFVLEDDSTHAPPAADAKLSAIDETALAPAGPAAFRFESARVRRPGKTTLRDYDPARPALLLEGVAQAGTSIEEKVEVYAAPGRFADASAGNARAKLFLEALRATASTVTFDTNAPSLAPGTSLEIEAPSDLSAAISSGKFFVVAVEHRFERSPSTLVHRVTAVPLTVPYRLPIVTPKPRISGVQSAIVSGAAGAEITVDDACRVRVHFPWDREQPADDKASLPVRVVQPNTPGSMLVPRVGWEVLVAYEDGDPDRPYVLGRTYNGTHPPPFPLPANKTMTALSTVSSPGGGKHNSVTFDDAAGRQHLVWNAGFAKTTTAGNDLSTQTVGFEATTVKADQTRTIGASHTLSVTKEMVTKVGSQTASVGGSQALTLKAEAKTAVGSETVAVGGALLEQVGNPADGAANFAEAAVLAGVGQIPVVGSALTKGYTVGKALGQAYAQGGTAAMLTAAEQQAAGLVAGEIPGGDALVAAADTAGLTPWSPQAQQANAARAAAGGTGGPAGAGPSAAAAAPGIRKTIVNGIMAETIGAAHTVTTPGSIKWTTLGASSFAIGGSHSTSAVKISRLTGGISSDTSATTSIKTSKAIGRNVTGAMKTSIEGALKSDAGGAHYVTTDGSFKLVSSGDVDFEGDKVVFVVGSSIVAAHSGGVIFKASTVTINGVVKQSGKTTNG